MSWRVGILRFAIFLSVVFNPTGCTFTTLFPCCLSIRRFCYDLSVSIFCSKIFLSFSHSVVDMASPILRLIVGRTLTFCLVFKVYPSFSPTNLAPAYIKSFTLWCRLSGYLSIICSLSRFRTWLSSSLCP